MIKVVGSKTAPTSTNILLTTSDLCPRKRRVPASCPSVVGQVHQLRDSSMGHFEILRNARNGFLAAFLVGLLEGGKKLAGLRFRIRIVIVSWLVVV